MTPVWAHHETSPELYAALTEFVALRVWGRHKDFPLGSAMGVADGDRIVAAVIFTNYDRDAGVIEMSAAADTARWLTRPILSEMFGYAFDQMKCQAVVLRCDPDNKRMNRIATAYGFRRYEIPRLRGRDKPEVLFVLSDDDWRK